MTDYDISIAAVNKKSKAVVYERMVNADTLGNVTIAFISVVSSQVDEPV